MEQWFKCSSYLLSYRYRMAQSYYYLVDEVVIARMSSWAMTWMNDWVTRTPSYSITDRLLEQLKAEFRDDMIRAGFCLRAELFDDKKSIEPLDCQLRAELRNAPLRAALLNDRHTLLMLPDFRKRLYEMSLRDPAESIIQSQRERRRSHYGMFLSVGDDEQFFQVLNDKLNMIAMNNTPWLHYRNLIELSRLIKKTQKNGKLPRELREVLAKVTSKSGTEVLLDQLMLFLEGIIALFPNSGSFELESASNVTVLLYFVYQYLMGYVARGGPKTYSSGSLDFRDIYISIVLFHGAYVWIKFRQAARSGSLKRKSCESQDVQVGDESNLKGVYARAMKDKSGTITHYKYEPRFKPPREKLESGITLQFNCLALGQYNTPGEARIVLQIAAYYYGKDERLVALADGSFFSIPPMSEQERSFSGEEKRKWITSKAKKVFEDFQKEKATLKLLRATETGAYSGHGSDGGSDPSPSAVAVTCSFPTPSRSADEHSEISSLGLVQLAPSQGGNVTEQHAVSEPGSSTIEPIPAIEHVSGVNCSGVQDNVPGKENDAPGSVDHDKILGHADDYSETLSGFEDIIAELFSDEFDNISPQQSSFPYNQMHHLGVPEILGDHSPPPQFDAATQGFAFVVPQLNPNLNFQQGWDFVGAVPETIVTSGPSLFLKERDPVLGQVNHLQQLVSRQKKLLEDAAIRNVDVQHQLSESEVKNLELQREKSVLQQENAHLRAMLQQVAKSQVATWSGIIIDIQQEEGS